MNNMKKTNPDLNIPSMSKARNGLLVSYDGQIHVQKEARRLQRNQQEFMNCLRRTNELQSAADEMPFLRTLARHCHLVSLPQELCIRLVCQLQVVSADESLVRSVFRMVYAKPTRRQFTTASKQQDIVRGVRDFLRRRYQLRYNVLKGMEEFCPNDGSTLEWQTLDERQLNRMTCQMMMEGGYGSRIDLQVYLHSAELPSYNPVTEFLESCPKWNHVTDQIRSLSNRIPTDHPHFHTLFRRWFLAMVAQWKGLNHHHGNMLVPLLIGGQGTHKTTFCRMLLPPCLHEYFMDDIKLDNAEQVERTLCRMALVNIDEFNAKTEREQAKVKRILSEHNVQMRHMRSEHYALRERMASFIATTNDMQPLTDPSGSRRYLCIPVNAPIRTARRINYPQLYAQALYLLEQGERCYLTTKEEREMQQYNRRFMRQCPVDFLLDDCLVAAPHSQEYLMTVHEVYEALCQKICTDMVPPSIREVSRYLRTHFPAAVNNGKRGFYLKIVIVVR